MSEQLTKAQINALRSIQEDHRWDAIEQVKELLIIEFGIKNVSGNDAYTELKSLHIQQGKMEGLERFFQILEKLAIE